MTELTAGHANAGGALAEAAEVDGERAIAVQGAEGADAVADARGEDGELGVAGELGTPFQLGRGDEADGHAGYGVGGRIEGEGEERRRTAGPAFGPTAAGAEAFGGSFGEGLAQKIQGRVVDLEEMEIEVEGLAGGDGAAVEVGGAKDVGPGAVGEAAGTGVERLGLEEAGVGCGAGLTEAEQGESEGAAEDVGGFAGGKADGVPRDKGEAERIEAEIQTLFYAVAPRRDVAPVRVYASTMPLATA